MMDGLLEGGDPDYEVLRQAGDQVDLAEIERIRILMAGCTRANGACTLNAEGLSKPAVQSPRSTYLTQIDTGILFFMFAAKDLGVGIIRRVPSAAILKQFRADVVEACDESIVNVIKYRCCPVESK